MEYSFGRMHCLSSNIFFEFVWKEQQQNPTYPLRDSMQFVTYFKAFISKATVVHKCWRRCEF